MSKLSSNDLERLSQELASLARTKIPLPDGLRNLSSALRDSELKKVVSEIAAGLDQGKTLADSMRQFESSLPKEYIQIIECAESSGDLGDSLYQVLEHGRMRKRHRSELGTALFYPVAVVITIVGIFLFFATYINPLFVEIYTQLGAELPLITTLMITLSQMFSGLTGLVVAVLVFFLFFFFAFSHYTRQIRFQIVSIIPGLGNLMALSDTAIVMRFLGIMLKQGVPLPKALRAAELSASHPAYKRSLKTMAEKAEQGGEISDVVPGEMPATAFFMFSRGEQRGELGEACHDIATYCEERFQLVSRRCTSILEPLLVLFISLFIGVAIISLYLPLFSIPRLVM